MENKKIKIIGVSIVIITVLSFGCYYLYKTKDIKNNLLGDVSKHEQAISLMELEALNKKVNIFGKGDSISDENLNSYLDTRFERLTYIASHKKETEYYLVQSIKDKDTEEYKSVLKEYILSDFKIGEFTKEDIADRLSKTREQDKKDETDYFYDEAHFYLSPRDESVSFFDERKAIVILSDMDSSGEYNADNYLYTIKIENGIIQKNIPVAVFYNQKNKKVELLESIEGRQLTGHNIWYDTQKRQMAAAPHKPFGGYPCSEVSYFEISFDRLILVKKEVPEYCIGRDFSDPSSKDFDKIPKTVGDTIFDKIKTLYQASGQDIESAKSFDLDHLVGK